MPKWLAELTGDRFDLEDFPEWFTDPYLTVVEDSGGYYLKSTSFASLEDATSVRSTAQELSLQLIGAAKLFRPDLRPVQVSGTIVQITEDGKKHHYVLVVDSGVMRTKISGDVRLSVNGERGPTPIPKPTIWATVARENKKVQQALRFWKDGLDSWIVLYKIWEVIWSDVGKEIYAKRWTTKEDVRRFKQTANSYEALGEDARHAHNKTPAPAEPMTINEAKHLIKSLLENWIEDKAN